MLALYSIAVKSEKASLIRVGRGGNRGEGVFKYATTN